MSCRVAGEFTPQNEMQLRAMCKALFVSTFPSLLPFLPLLFHLLCVPSPCVYLCRIMNFPQLLWKNHGQLQLIRH